MKYCRGKKYFKSYNFCWETINKLVLSHQFCIAFSMSNL